MPTLKEQIVDLLEVRPSLTDREIADRIKGCGQPQQSVNQACRQMETARVLARRRREDGLIGNYLTGVPLTVGQSRTKGRDNSVNVLSEDEVKKRVVSWLELQGWNTRVAWGRNRGIDIEALKGEERWLIEAKGCGSLAPMRVNYFLAILGETLQRMDDPRARYSIALPDMPQFRGLWDRLPQLAKKRTHINALFVCEDGQITFMR